MKVRMKEKLVDIDKKECLVCVCVLCDGDK